MAYLANTSEPDQPLSILEFFNRANKKLQQAENISLNFK